MNQVLIIDFYDATTTVVSNWRWIVWFRSCVLYLFLWRMTW